MGKDAVGKRAGRPGRPIRWPDVLRALEADDVRQEVMSTWKIVGSHLKLRDEFTPDGFAHSRAARDAMMNCLTQAEDWLEVRHPRRAAERDAIRKVRRALELELR